MSNQLWKERRDRNLWARPLMKYRNQLLQIYFSSTVMKIKIKSPASSWCLATPICQVQCVCTIGSEEEGWTTLFIFPPEFYSNIGMMIIFACIMYICNMWWRSIVQCTSQEKLQECSFVVSGELIAFFWPAPRSQKGSRRRKQGGDRWWPDVR